MIKTGKEQIDTQEIKQAILAIHTTMPEVDLETGSAIIQDKWDQFQSLSNPFVQMFIKSLPNLIDARKQLIESETDTEELIEDEIGKLPCDAAASSEVTGFAPFFEGQKSKVQSNKNLFNKLKTLNPKGKAKLGSKRMNQFVMTLGTPDLPRRHPGVDDSLHPGLDINFKWLDLLQRGLTTLKYVNNKSRKQALCPNLIFLRGPIEESEDAATKEIMTDHTLDAFASQIKRERQLPIEFHFAGHGSPESIGTTESIANVGDQIRMTPEDFAEHFNHIAQLSGLDKELKSKPKGINFVFHTCNSAYFDYDEEISIEEQVIEKTAIGRFYRKMVELGYTNFTVSGYRGFYSAMESGSNITISDSALEHNKTLETVNGDKAKFTISYSKNTKKPAVTTVDCPKKYATFPLQPQTTDVENKPY